jgi:hypothetical protein
MIIPPQAELLGSRHDFVKAAACNKSHSGVKNQSGEPISRCIDVHKISPMVYQNECRDL